MSNAMRSRLVKPNDQSVLEGMLWPLACAANQKNKSAHNAITMTTFKTILKIRIPYYSFLTVPLKPNFNNPSKNCLNWLLDIPLKSNCKLPRKLTI